MKNNDFYSGKNGSQIMDVNNFNKEVIRYLNYEQAYISKILNKNKYSVLLELGCDEVRLHGNSSINGVKYIGVDIRHELKLRIENYFLKNKGIDSKFIVSCLSNYDEQLDLENNSVLCIFPFNLIGNLDGCKSHIEKCYRNNFDVVISQFSTTKYAEITRSKYYDNCGIPNLLFEKTEECDTFKGLGFESKSYKSSYIAECCEKIGFTYVDCYETELICIQYFSRSGKC